MYLSPPVAVTDWFQPLGASGFRHGLSAQVHVAMIEFNAAGEPVWDFSGKKLLKGETDGSSFPNGGLRATHSAGAYLGIDPTSPVFLRGDTIFIPATMVSYHGHALDEKTPLLRASDALSREGARLLSLLGMRGVTGVRADIGLEQEFFLVPRGAYLRRPDLQLVGRTVIGRQPPRSQEVCDHYMAPPSLSSPALACLQAVQEECFKLGIPLRTRHREVAPNQYEFAPMFGSVTTQTDQNVVVMQARRAGRRVWGEIHPRSMRSPPPFPRRSSRRWQRSTASPSCSRRSPSRAQTARGRCVRRARPGSAPRRSAPHPRRRCSTTTGTSPRRAPRT